jgi:hypothetical protein
MVTIIVVLAIAAGFAFLLIKSGVFADDNGNNVPDVVEKPIVKVVERVKKTTKKATAKKSAKKSK